jgi:uncharacterized protein (DUF1800 family)
MLRLAAAPAHLGAQAAPRPGGSSVQSAETARAVHLLNRATYGVRAEDVAEVLRLGRNRWLELQLHPETIADPIIAKRLEFPGAPTIAVQSVDLPTFMGMSGAAPVSPSDTAVAHARVADLQRAHMAFSVGNAPGIGVPATAKLQRAVFTERQLEEVMTDFWFNHFNVVFDKLQIGRVLADYETNAIRKNVFGKFEDMLVATARHPAMLMYLDNAFSRTPGMEVLREGQPRQLTGGINENYARELLELHTLGVDAGYTQQDIIEVARAFTGWTIPTTRGPAGDLVVSQAAGAYVFTFRPEWHDAGQKTVLGRPLSAGRGMEDALDILKMLAHDPRTARRVATKLVRHFVSDDSPPQLIDRLADVFMRTDGDLREVTRALFTSDVFYAEANSDNKVKRPFEFVASSLRATHADLKNLLQTTDLITKLREFAHVPYQEPQPTGYPTAAERWVGAGQTLARLRFASDLVNGKLTSASVEARTVLAAQEASSDGTPSAAQAEVMARLTPRDAAARIVRSMLPGRTNQQLEDLVAAELEKRGTLDPAALAAGISLVLGSPHFQRY